MKSSSPPSPLSHASGRGAGGEGDRSRPVVHVAVGVLVRPDRAVLLADRPAGKPYAGYWEFPGGKIEDGELVEHALARELAEELHITIGESVPWVVFDFDYPHAYVRLQFRRVYDWHGKPEPVEGQRLTYYRPGDPAPDPLLPAARPVMRWLRLPDRLIWAPERAAQVKLQPSDHWIDGMRFAASAVRDADELAQAAALGADFVVVPFLPEPQLADLSRDTPIPVYATDPGDADALKRLQRLGVHGIAEVAPNHE